MDKIDAMLIIARDYKNHPCGAKFCKKCDWPLYPPQYPGDWWDCSNKDCGFTKESTKGEYKKMWP